MIPRTALSLGTKMVRGSFVDDMKNGRVKSFFVAAEVARDVRHDVHAGTPALKALRMIVSLTATRDGKHRSAQHSVLRRRGSVRARPALARLWGLFTKTVCWRKEGECFLLLKALWHSNGFETVAAALHESTQNAWMESEQGNAWILSPRRPCRNVRVVTETTS